MSRWNEPHKQNEREWKSLEPELKRVRSELDGYVFDPFTPATNDTYNVEASKAYRFSKLNFLTTLFLLPTTFATHTIEKLLTPLPPKELPKIPPLPPLQPTVDADRKLTSF